MYDVDNIFRLTRHIVINPLKCFDDPSIRCLHGPHLGSLHFLSYMYTQHTKLKIRVLSITCYICFFLFFFVVFFFSAILNILIEACVFDNSWDVLLVGGGILLKFSLIRGEFRFFSCGVRGSHIFRPVEESPLQVKMISPLSQMIWDGMHMLAMCALRSIGLLASGDKIY